MKNYSHRLLEVFQARSQLLPWDETKLKRLNLGFQGEERFAQFLKEVGQRHWKVYRNIYLDVSGAAQYDFFVVTGAEIYMFEIKNYHGELQYEAGQWLSNQRRLPNNFYTQLQRAQEKLATLFYQEGKSFQVQPNLVLINKHCDFESDATPPCQTLLSNQLATFFKKINAGQADPATCDILTQLFKKYEASDNLQHIRDTYEYIVRPGVYCLTCGSFNMTTSWKMGHCLSCTASYSKTDLAKLLYQEYQLLHPSKVISDLDLERFSSKQISRATFYRVRQSQVSSSVTS